MRGLPRIQYAPRSGATYEAPTDVLVPALMKLRDCKDSLSVLMLVESLPDLILPALAYVASRKRYIPSFAVQTLVQCCGPLFLERCLGEARSRELLTRYPKRAALSGV